ncbi:trace amine-associated receptor 7d [Nematostella vectensis]|uniref:trace amine-associated receptor 7d n=1 Tax=Nematostella vectensis TaxID=45351 RepID=UPI00138FA188|nr:trace amine-associated receptor 7d [Nematostella vectensis]
MENASQINSTNGTESGFLERFLLHQTSEGRIALGVLGLEILLIISTNTLVFLLVARYKELRRKSNYCLISLAMSDVLAGLVSLPLVIACSTTSHVSICTTMDLCQRFLSISTIFHLVVATGERYVKIRNPLKYKYVATSSRILGVLVLVWLFSLFVSLIQLAWIDLPDSRSYDLTFTIVCLTLLAFLPFAAIVGGYGHMIYIIKQESIARSLMMSQGGKPRKGMRRRENERKVLLVYLGMALSFALGWFPYFIITLLQDLGRVKQLTFWTSIFLLSLKFTTALVNPLLYTFFKADFQKAVRGFVRGDDLKPRTKTLSKV